MVRLVSPFFGGGLVDYWNQIGVFGCSASFGLAFRACFDSFVILFVL